ncbi:hypothetical protein Scep_003508 [Stephania cephalantha]|uniref:Uncharacterized protein n=1 Tax=Stephania cephalantha TaxID=152367 RepID=A0AAP0KS93_9MAGN
MVLVHPFKHKKPLQTCALGDPNKNSDDGQALPKNSSNWMRENYSVEEWTRGEIYRGNRACTTLNSMYLSIIFKNFYHTPFHVFAHGFE